MKHSFSIMLVDDDEDDQLIFTSVINEIDEEIDCCCVDNPINGLERLSVNNSYKPDCIFLDLNLPLMHGFEFLQSIKNSDALNSIPVIIYSTSSRESDKIKATQLGAANYLCKQTSYTELKHKITELLNSVSSS